LRRRRQATQLLLDELVLVGGAHVGAGGIDAADGATHACAQPSDRA
jgi:hypothetical protein